MMKRPDQRMELDLPDAAPARETVLDDELCPRSVLARPLTVTPGRKAR